MSSNSQSGTEGAVTAVAGAFEEALVRFQGWRKNRRNRRSGESELQDSLESGRDDLKTEFYKLRDEHGAEFERGDEIASSSLLKIANEIQHTIIAAVDKAESIFPRGYDVPDLNPSDLWQKSEKIRKSASFCMGELVLRIKTRKTNQSSYTNNSSRFQTPANSPPLRSQPIINNAPISHNYLSGPHTINEQYYPPPMRFATNNTPLYTQPETPQQQHNIPRFHEPEYVDSQSHWRLPSQPTHEPEYSETQSHWRLPAQPTPPYQSPEIPQAPAQGLPDSLRISMPAYRPPPPAQRQRPASVSMSGTGYISRLATPTPFTEPIAQRPFTSAPLPRPGAQERTSYGFSQDERNSPDTRRATVGYTKPSQFGEVGLGMWTTGSPPREQPCVPMPALYSPISLSDEFLDVSEHGHFRMPTPVNHGGMEFHQQ